MVVVFVLQITFTNRIVRNYLIAIYKWLKPIGHIQAPASQEASIKPKRPKSNYIDDFVIPMKQKQVAQSTATMKLAPKSNPLFDPRLCTYKLNPKVRGIIESLIKEKSVDTETKVILAELMEFEEGNKNTLDYESLVKLHKYYQRADPDYQDPFYVFSESCKCIEPKPRDNQALDKRIKMLRLKETQLIYNKLAYTVDRSIKDKIARREDGRESPGGPTEFKDLYGSVIAVFNSFLVYICTFIFCYKALEYSLEKPDVTLQAMFGFVASLVVAVAELYFIFRVV